MLFHYLFNQKLFKKGIVDRARSHYHCLENIRKIKTNFWGWTWLGPLPLSLHYCSVPHWPLDSQALPQRNLEWPFWNVGVLSLKFSMVLQGLLKRCQLQHVMRLSAVSCHLVSLSCLCPTRTLDLSPTKDAWLCHLWVTVPTEPSTPKCLPFCCSLSI